MTDTPGHVQQLYRTLLLQRSGAERVRMACRMFDGARALVRASLGDPEGRNASAQMRAALFLRTYGRDFDARTRERIAGRLRLSATPAAR